MKILTVNEVQNSINQIKHHNDFKDKIISIVGYYSKSYLYHSKNDAVADSNSKIEFNPHIHGGLKEKMFKKHSIDEGDIILVCMLKQPLYIQIDHIFKIELLDDKGKIVDELKVDEMSMPEEIRGII